ncbi:EG45-like domain containing protein 2 isoform X2 [Eutrema salsugineum]|nr:EG45-like domain containing protein 2 isoform X2 [Eutrema salsugineum]
MVLKLVIMVIVFAQILAPIVEAAQGRAVYYNPPYTRSACSGRQYETMVVGLKSNLYQGGRACGRRYRVRCIGATYNFPGACTGRTVVVKVVDFCREPCNGDLNLSRDAFQVIANTNAGNIRVEYTP